MQILSHAYCHIRNATLAERFAYRFNPLLMIPNLSCFRFIALVIAWFTKREYNRWQEQTE
jgi:hypothetical protein